MIWNSFNWDTFDWGAVAVAGDLSIRYSFPDRGTPYLLVWREPDFAIWNGSAFVAYVSADRASYATVLDSADGRTWATDFPIGIADGTTVKIEVAEQLVGADMSDGDVPLRWFSFTPGPIGTLAGPSSVTITWRDDHATLIPSVDFTISGVGSGRGNGSGIASFGMANGTYSVVSRTTNMVSFNTTALVVNGTTTLTITGNTIVPSMPAAPGFTSAALLVLNADGSTNTTGITFYYKVVGGVGTAGTAYSSQIQSAQSNSSGVLTLSLIKGAVYDIRREDGDWLHIRASSSNTMSLPEILGSTSIT